MPGGFSSSFNTLDALQSTMDYDDVAHASLFSNLAAGGQLPESFVAAQSMDAPSPSGFNEGAFSGSNAKKTSGRNRDAKRLRRSHDDDGKPAASGGRNADDGPSRGL